MDKRKQRSDSVDSQVAAAQTQRHGYSVPEGLSVLTKKEKVAWNQYCLCRDSWTEAELRGVHRIVKLETELGKLRVEARRTPRTYTKSGGTVAVHPIHTEVRTTQKLIHSELRVIGLNTSAERAVGAARNGKLAIPDGEDGDITGQEAPPVPSGKPSLNLIA